MEDLIMLVNRVRDNNKESFSILMEKFQPLINKYTYLLYKDEKEDTEAELYIALWESVMNIPLIESDGQVFNYFSTAIKYRFLELYRASKKQHDNEIFMENDKYLSNLTFQQYEYDNFTVIEDIKDFLKQFRDSKRKIYYMMLIENKSDTEIAEMLNLSRQYVNRMRRQLQSLLQQYFNNGEQNL